MTQINAEKNENFKQISAEISEISGKKNKNIHLVPYFNPVFYECPKQSKKFGCGLANRQIETQWC
jgi:hypothetical protein